MSMKRQARSSSTTRWVSAESAVAESLVALDASGPGWDEGPRLEGAIRRLSRDASQPAIRAAVAIYGEDVVRQALDAEEVQRAAARRVPEVRVVADLDVHARLRRLSKEILRSDADVAVHFTPRELQVLTLLAAGVTISNAAQELGWSKGIAVRHVLAVRRKLTSTSAKKAVELAEAMAALTRTTN